MNFYNIYICMNSHHFSLLPNCCVLMEHGVLCLWKTILFLQTFMVALYMCHQGHDMFYQYSWYMFTFFEFCHESQPHECKFILKSPQNIAALHCNALPCNTDSS